MGGFRQPKPRQSQLKIRNEDSGQFNKSTLITHLLTSKKQLKNG